MQIYQIEIYEALDGKCPYSEWLDNLSDIAARAKIRTRLDRATIGNFGKTESVGAGVYEFKIDFGPGYRVYFGLDEAERKIILLLCGGTKKRQQKDVKRAQDYWKEAKAEKRAERRGKDAKKKLS
jgi:putative addiction module killer protein